MNESWYIPEILKTNSKIPILKIYKSKDEARKDITKQLEDEKDAQVELWVEAAWNLSRIYG